MCQTSKIVAEINSCVIEWLVLNNVSYHAVGSDCNFPVQVIPLILPSSEGSEEVPSAQNLFQEKAWEIDLHLQFEHCKETQLCHGCTKTMR